ncbi:MAG TPA: TIGR04283 family arsenosugar biosynthesis glycosyltransferase [Bacillales bacterium]
MIKIKDTISIIIPTLNEGPKIQKLLTTVEKMNNVEVIIVDGGSVEPIESIMTENCRVLHSERGRSRQMNKGAEAAKGDILWFLHADSKVPENAADLIREAMESRTVVGGGFSLKFDYDAFLFKIIEKGSNFRAKYGKIFFGDQSFFVRQKTFKELEGFPDVTLMEDWILSRKARKKGGLVLLPERIITSARRFRKYGPLRTFLFMLTLQLLFLLGVPPDKLGRFYSHG